MQIELVWKRVLQSQAVDKPILKAQPKLQWTAGTTNLVELIYALKVGGCFGNATLKELFTIIGGAFGCDLHNGERIWVDIRNRKKNRIVFISQLEAALEERIKYMDGRVFR
jgi:hypothetical protein